MLQNIFAQEWHKLCARDETNTEQVFAVVSYYDLDGKRFARLLDRVLNGYSFSDRCEILRFNKQLSSRHGYHGCT